MIRTQVQLTEAQARALKELAGGQGISVAELIRRSVERTLAENNERDKWERASEVVGRFHGGPTDVSRNHDTYLAEDYL